MDSAPFSFLASIIGSSLPHLTSPEELCQQESQERNLAHTSHFTEVKGARQGEPTEAAINLLLRGHHHSLLKYSTTWCLLLKIIAQFRKERERIARTIRTHDAVPTDDATD